MNMTHFMKYYIFSILIGMIAHNNDVSININDCDIRRNINNTTILRTNRLLLAESTIEENVAKIKELEKTKLEESKGKKGKKRSSRNKFLCPISEKTKYIDKRLCEELENKVISLYKGSKNISIHDIKNRRSFRIKVAFSKFILCNLIFLLPMFGSISLLYVGYRLTAENIVPFFRK